MDFRIRGTEGGAQFDIGDTDIELLEAGTAGVEHYADIQLTGDASITGYAQQDEQFLDAIAAGRQPETNTIEEALLVQRVIDAIYRSSESGQAEAIEMPELERASETDLASETESESEAQSETEATTRLE